MKCAADGNDCLTEDHVEGECQGGVCSTFVQLKSTLGCSNDGDACVQSDSTAGTCLSGVCMFQKH